MSNNTSFVAIPCHQHMVAGAKDLIILYQLYCISICLFFSSCIYEHVKYFVRVILLKGRVFSMFMQCLSWYRFKFSYLTLTFENISAKRDVETLCKHVFLYKRACILHNRGALQRKSNRYSRHRHYFYITK